MITKFRGMNISSKDPKRLVLFYQDIMGLNILDNDPNYDGVTFGKNKAEPVCWIWDENKWGKSNEGPACLVFDCDDHHRMVERQFCYFWINLWIFNDFGSKNSF